MARMECAIIYPSLAQTLDCLDSYVVLAETHKNKKGGREGGEGGEGVRVLVYLRTLPTCTFS